MAQASAEACFEWTREYIHGRTAFGKPLSAMQTIRHKMAGMKTDLAAGRALVLRSSTLNAILFLHCCGIPLSTPFAHHVRSQPVLIPPQADMCLELHKDGRLDSATASMCKIFCTDLQNKVFLHALHFPPFSRAFLHILALP